VVLSVIVMQLTQRLLSTTSRPSSSGSKIPTTSEEVRQFTWCKGIFRFNISAKVTALLIALSHCFKNDLIRDCSLKEEERERKNEREFKTRDGTCT